MQSNLYALSLMAGMFTDTVHWELHDYNNKLYGYNWEGHLGGIRDATNILYFDLYMCGYICIFTL